MKSAVKFLLKYDSTTNHQSSVACGCLECTVQTVLCTDCEMAFAFQRVLFCPSNLSIKNSIEGILISMPTPEVRALHCHPQWCSSVAEIFLLPLLFKLCDLASISMWFSSNTFSSNLMWRWQVCKFLQYLDSCKQCYWIYFPLISQIILIVDALVVFQSLRIICNEIFPIIF